MAGVVLVRLAHLLEPLRGRRLTEAIQVVSFPMSHVNPLAKPFLTHFLPKTRRRFQAGDTGSFLGDIHIQ